MQKSGLDLILLTSIKESQIYRCDPLVCIYYITAFRRYCEVEVREVKESRDEKEWYNTPTLLFSYTLPKDIELEILANTYKTADNKRQKYKNKVKILEEALFFLIALSSKDDKLEALYSSLNNSREWHRHKYGWIFCSNSYSNSLEFALVPDLSIIELFTLLSS
jgi:CTP synthase (UTP-ammonia lyase)